MFVKSQTHPDLVSLILCLHDTNLLLHSGQVIKHLLLDNLPILPMGDYANLDVDIRW